MRKLGYKLLSGCLTGILGMVMVYAGQVFASEDENQEIAKRISKVGSVCIEGEDCSKNADTQTGVAAASEDTGSGGIETRYNSSCKTCHGEGIAGAPKSRDPNAWAPRVEKGMEVLYESALNGLPPGMPAKGLCFDCSDDELKALVDYMLEGAK